MASFKINFAACRGLPSPRELVRQLEEFGLAEDQEMGVLSASAGGAAAYGTLIRRTHLVVQQMDPKTREITPVKIEKITPIPFGLFPAVERMEVYAGSWSSIEQVGAFLSSCLALAVAVDQLEVDLADSVNKLMRETQRFQLRAARVQEYAANSYMIGPYAPAFADSDHGQKFLTEYGAAMKTVKVRFAAPSNKATVTLTPNGCFAYTCEEDDQPAVQDILRKLAV